MLQLYELCRLCAQKKRQQLNVFSNLTEEEANVLLAKISLCVSVNVTQEDLLPKNICFDCQKTVEQFNTFRIKCHKAEERLSKMLSMTLPSKFNVTGIKQEHLEPDFCENNFPVKADSSIPFANLKSVKIVKSEVDETVNELNSNCTSESSELIKIISEEMVNQNQFIDIKQPHIEIISENLSEECKENNLNQENHYFTCDIKLIPETLIRTEEEFNIINCNTQIQESITEIKEQVLEGSNELSKVTTTSNEERLKSVKINSSKKNQTIKKKNGGIIPEVESNYSEIDEKYLVLREGEVCDIDLEEMESLIKKKQNPDMKFSCSKCKKSFKFFKCYKKHKQWHSSQPELFICDFCKNENAPNFEFCSFKSLNNHIQRKHLNINSSKYECHLCHRVLPSLGQLKAHCKRVHDESGVTCETCGKKFKNQSCLNSHNKVHQEERPYICDLCGQSFKWSNALKVHIMCHKQEKNFLCSECGKKFSAKKNLMEHLNIHTGKRPYTCETCNATFVQLSAFSKHLYLHNNSSRTHKCDKCNITFSHAYMLKQHLLRHTGLRPYKCTICHSSFKSQSDLCGHSKIHKEKQYGCQVCGKKFAASKTLKDHMVRHTGIKHICPAPDCGKTYTQRFSLTKHFSKQHPLLNIVKKKSGKKSHLAENAKDFVDSDFIRYHFEKREYTNGLV